MQRVTFPTTDGPSFISDLKLRVSEYFDSHRLSRNATPAMVLKTAIVYGVTLGSYALILFGHLHPMAMLGLAIVMGMGIAGIGFCVAHDALHGAYSSRPRVNQVLGWSFDLIGASSYLWRILHNVVHHTYPNVHGVDEDLEVSVLMRLSPHTERRPFHRFQHLYAFAAYSLSTLNWVFLKDYKYALRPSLGPFNPIKHRKRDIAAMMGWKIFYYTWTILIPVLVLRIPWWQFVIGYVAMHLTAGVILGVVFQLAHIVEDTEHPVASEEGSMEHTWAAHQMETTSDFARNSRWLTWYVGGLNFQVEHHLFPKVCSIHYPALSRIVREVAEEHGIEYNDHPTLWAAIRSHSRMLKLLGSEPAAV